MSFEIENTTRTSSSAQVNNTSGTVSGVNTGINDDGSIFESRNMSASVGDEVVSTKKEPELYDKVKVQPWGTGEDDCLSRIIQKHVDGVKLYSDDYNQFIKETCKLNNIKDPNIIWGEIKLPELKRNEDGSLLKDENGKLQFFSEDELKTLKE